MAAENGKMNVDRFVFDRVRADNFTLPKDTVTVLGYPFKVPAVGDIDDDFRQAFIDSRVYLIGTAHFSAASQQDVIKVIEATQPDLVMVELCPAHAGMLVVDEQTLLVEAKDISWQKIRAVIQQNGLGLEVGVAWVVLASLSAYMTKQLGMAPGGEFRAAYREAQKVGGCRVLLGDRPIQVTLRRALDSLSFWQRLRLFSAIIAFPKIATVSQEDVERRKQGDWVEEFAREMAGEFPKLTRVLLDERDQFMVYHLRTYLHNTIIAKRQAALASGAEKYQPVNVVAVVGVGHVRGMVANWRKQVDISGLMSVQQPQQSRWWSQYSSLAVKGAMVGISACAFYRFGRYASRRFLQKK